MDEQTYSDGSIKTARGLVLLALVLGIGTMGYMIIEKWTFLDALYMTVITITTVGYGEIREVHGVGRIFTIIIIFMGMGIIAYALGSVAQTMVELQIKSIFGGRKLGLKIKSLQNHYILCGYGRIGKVISQELKFRGIPFIVVDNAPGIQEILENEDIPYIIGDASSEDILLEAGIMRARGLVSLVASDADNLFITMTARGLKPDLFILVRADEESTEKKLLRAGADRVVLPYLIGGQKMAQTIIRPAVTDFLEFAVHNKDMGINMEEFLVGKESRLSGLTLIDSGIRQEMNVIIVAIRKGSGKMEFNPSSKTLMEAGDTLIAMGYTADLDRLKTVCECDSRVN